MIAALAADAIVLLHLAFILFALLGGLLVLRQRRWLLLHLPALAWGLWIEIRHGLCPLTRFENAFRLRAGEQGYDGGFIERYLIPLIYPAGLRPEHQLVIGVVFALWSVGVYGLVLHRWRRRAARR